MNVMFKLAVCIAGCEAVGIIGLPFTMRAIPTWYAGLKKPPLNPPGWIFGPVWTTLYLLMGVSIYLVWRTGLDKEGVKLAIAVFLIQLLLNAIWTPLFFGMHSLLSGLIDIALLWAGIILTIILTWQISAWAGILLIPYLLWVSFAAVLNFHIWKLNS